MSNLCATRKRDGSSREIEFDGFASAVAESIHQTTKDTTGDQSSSRLGDSCWQSFGRVPGSDFQCASSRCEDDVIRFAVGLVSQPRYQPTTGPV